MLSQKNEAPSCMICPAVPINGTDPIVSAEKNGFAAKAVLPSVTSVVEVAFVERRLDIVAVPAVSVVTLSLTLFDVVAFNVFAVSVENTPFEIVANVALKLTTEVFVAFRLVALKLVTF